MWEIRDSFACGKQIPPHKMYGKTGLGRKRLEVKKQRKFLILSTQKAQRIGTRFRSLSASSNDLLFMSCKKVDGLQK